ncbi:hypothetical protein KIPE111705_05585 [Kibdelosporangium persicum]|uniref:DUF222 domain-containing protein n=1 Tax=Kibdelosporangium persicum TaxID=2698649 RepID=A0ABX2FCW1_9PSEU|nr:hypothetical protein [Kibdelosporangium persicum]NRN69206.1 hypothetical protein [Kibdelosporangium persicum]
MPIDDPTTATPSEIDEELARLDIEHAKAQDALNKLTARVQRLVNDGMAEYATELQPRIEQARQTIVECEAAARPLDAEFERRGGWTRAWLVLNTGGHVHRTMACRTCFPSTRFAWLTQLSGHDETEIVEQVGKAACTECYPSAPVDIRNRPSRIKTPEQLAREAEKAERAKAKAAKAITAPDGTPLHTKGYGQIDTEFTARRSYADALAYARHLARASIAHHRDTIAEYREDARLILAALAAKHGRTEDDLCAELAPKVEARWKREYK